MWKSFDAGVDWVTTTCDKGKPEFEALDAFYVDQLQRAHREGHTLKNWHMQGYTCLRAGNVTVGWRADGILCQVRSGPAHQFAVQLGEIIKTPRVSRFDVQQTLLGDTDVDEAITQTFLEGHKKGFRLKRNRKTSMGIDVMASGGSILTIGHRMSDYFFRDYNKTAEQNNLVEAMLRRREMEVKGKCSDGMFAKWHHEGASRLWCLDVVSTAFNDRGLPLEIDDTSRTVGCVSSYTKTDDEKSLDWMQNIVARKARELVEKGHGSTLKKAFNLTDLVDVWDTNGVPIAYQPSEEDTSPYSGRDYVEHDINGKTP